MSNSLELPKVTVEPPRKLSASRGVHLADLKIVTSEHGFNSLNLGPTPPVSASSSIVGKVVNFSTQNNRISPVAPGTEDRLVKSLLELCIFLPNHSGLQYTVEGGRLATVSLLRNLVLNSIQLPPNAPEWFYEVFTLWMVSPLLEVQLKPHHIPFRVRKAWPDLLIKFVFPIDEEAIESDEPLLVLRRNVLLSRYRQQQLCHEYPDVVALLQSDAQESILEGKYGATLDQYLRLAAVQMAIEWGPFNSDRHSSRYIRDNLGDFLPDHVLHSVTSRGVFGFGLLSRCRHGVEDQILQLYQESSTIPSCDLKQKYLDICLEIPSYGCATFSGQIEQRGDMKLMKSGDLKVTVGINRHFVCIVDAVKKTNLLTVPIVEDLTWTKADPVEQNNPDCLPSLFLHFPDYTSSNNQSKLIQIFSKQVCMMNALLNSIVDTPSDEVEESDGINNQLVSNPKSSFVLDEELCAATIDKDGNCIDVVGSLANCVQVKSKKSPKRH